MKLKQLIDKVNEAEKENVKSGGDLLWIEMPIREILPAIREAEELRELVRQLTCYAYYAARKEADEMQSWVVDREDARTVWKKAEAFLRA